MAKYKGALLCSIVVQKAYIFPTLSFNDKSVIKISKKPKRSESIFHLISVGTFSKIERKFI